MSVVNTFAHATVGNSVMFSILNNSVRKWYAAAQNKKIGEP